MAPKSGQVLVVDDNRINRMKLARSLEQQGHRVLIAENGQQALELLRAQPCDLLLLDILMPEMDGYQLLSVLKQDRALRELPVIVISAVDDMDSVVTCIKMGAQDYLPHSYDPVLLKARIDACLEKKWLRDQEIEYLRNVARLTAAAAAVEARTFDPESLADVSARSDELGQLARIFKRMVRDVYAREQRLKQQVQELLVKVDEAWW